MTTAIERLDVIVAGGAASGKTTLASQVGLGARKWSSNPTPEPFPPFKRLEQ